MEQVDNQKQIRSITRREFSLLALSLIGSSSLVLSGCGGVFGGGSGGGGNSGGLQTANGTLTLPPGVTLTDLVLTSSGGAAPLTSTSFAAKIAKGSPSLLMAIHATSYQTVLMGFADPSGGAIVLDAHSTAIALMYLGLGGSGLSGADRKTLLTAIADSTQAATLTMAIQTAQATDPFVLTNGDATLKAAIKTAVQTFSSSWLSAGSNSGGAVAMSALNPMLLIEPAAEVEGLTVVQTDANLGFQVQNRRRRSGVAYTYMVEHTSSTDVDTQENPPKAVGQPLYIPMTKNLLSLPYGWSQVTSDPKALSLSGDDKKTKFETILLATSFGGQTPAIYSDPRYSSFVQTWKDEAARLRQAGILQGVADLVLEVIGLGGALFEYATLTALIPQVLQTTAIGSGMAAAAAGNVYYEFVLEELLTSFSAEAIFALEIPSIEPLIARVSAQRAAELFAGQASANSIALARAGIVVLVVLGVLELVDVAAVAHDTHGGQEANVWELTAFQPKVQITPNTGKYHPGSTMSISASAPGIGAQGVTYQWSLSGSNLANLSDGTHVGTSFTSSSAVVTLGTTPSTQSDLTVSVTVFKNGVTVGTASATYEPGNGLDIQYFEISFGPRYQYPGGGGYHVAYVEIPLRDSARTIVEMHSTRNDNGFDGATASVFVKMPPKSTPVYPITQEIIAAQNMSYAQLQNEGNIYGYTYTNSSWAPDAAFRLVNYGDRILVWLGLTSWSNAAPSPTLNNSADALATLKAVLAQRVYDISIIG